MASEINSILDAPATSTRPPDGFTPLVGDCGVGAEALRPPGGVAEPPACPAPLGETGLGESLPHATASAPASNTTDPIWNTRFIKPSPQIGPSGVKRLWCGPN